MNVKRLVAMSSVALALVAPALAVNHADFGRLDGTCVVRAPIALAVTETNADGIVTHSVVSERRLSATDYLAQGWKRVIDEKPAASADGKVVVATDWTETADAITRNYREIDATPDAAPPRKFSKLKIYGAIVQMGAWEKVKAWLEAKDVDGVNGWTAFMLAQEVSEDHALFAPLAEEARQLLGLDAAAFETLLAACVLKEGY